MSVYVVYFDASGTKDDPNTPSMTVAGFVTTESKWRKFERDWAFALAAEGITILHMKEFAHSTGQFAVGWKNDEPRRRRFLQSLHRVIKRRTDRPISATLILSEYKAVDKVYKLHESIGQPYSVTAQLAITLTRKWMKRSHPKDDILFIFEKGDDDQAELAIEVKHFKLVVSPIFVEKDSHVGVPLQAGDFIAYEHGKVFNDLIKTGKQRLRKSAVPFIPNRRVDPMVQVFDSAALMSLVRDLKVPKR